MATLRADKHEIFRASRDAHKAADLLIAFEHHKSLDQALSHINKPQSSIEQQPTSVEVYVHDSVMAISKPVIEIEL